MTDWPFNGAELTAGLRRYLADPTLRIIKISEEPVDTYPALGQIRGVGIDLERRNFGEHYSYLLKQPQGTSRFGLAGTGVREVGLYRTLASQLPIAVPELVASDANGDWLLMEPYPTTVRPERWTAKEYRQAIINLAHLHDRFWGLAEDLSVFPWLGRPLTNDYPVYVMAAAKSLETIVRHDTPAAITNSMERLTALARLISQADVVSQVLQSKPQTLLHGDYWPGNISVDEDGDQIVYDWQMVSVGPGAIDIVVFITTCQWWFSPLPITPQEIVAVYRQEMAAHTGQTWTDQEWACQWDFALMWRFLQEWLNTLAAPLTYSLQDSEGLLEAVWLEPLGRAVDRWLRQLA
ncbi:MAG: aminoglycoside phosphotransferase family protein [Chloroflexi bacterium]|nr:aminoglycoside phosphotransferase family protein [Chloroflexota bacterium]